MKTKWIPLALIFLISARAFGASSIPEISSYLWVKLGNISGSGLMGGIELESSLSTELSIVVGEDFVRKGFTYGQNSFVLDYIEIPLLAKYQFDLGLGSLFIEGGPYFSYSISKPPSIEPIGNADLADTDIGGRLGTGYELPIQSAFSLLCSIDYEFGFMKVVRNSPPGDSGRNRSWISSVALGFRL